jgi:hypothetical protein
MSDRVVININMSRKCCQCQQKGATDSGLCLNCIAKRIAAKAKAGR